MPTKTTSYRHYGLPTGAYGDEEGYASTNANYRRAGLLNVSNWAYKPGTKKPDFMVQNRHEYWKSDRQGGAFVTSVVEKSTGRKLLTQIPDQAPFDFSPPMPPSLGNQALARFNGKVRKGSASLGVTLASWKQSREMITHRLGEASSMVDRAYRRLSRDPRRARKFARESEPLANHILETEFGWKPFFDDIRASLTTVCQDGVPPQFVTARAKSTFDSQASGPRFRYRNHGPIMCTLAASVGIDNPNVWLLNRMGLINPATVIWDLIPWSFVVNMFVNVNQMINSVTDEVGLNIGNRSTTWSAQLSVESWALFEGSGYATRAGQDLRNGDLVGYCRYQCNSRSRSVGTFPSPKWVVKVPDLDWELAAIACSLLLQKVGRLNHLIKSF